MSRNFIAAFITIIFILSFSSASWAGGESEYGFKVGVGSANLSGDVEEFVGKSDSKAVLSVGLFATGKIFGSFYIQPEILYSQKGAKTDDVFDVEVDLSYIEIPLLVKYRLDNMKSFRPNIFAGPAVNLLIGSKLDSYDAMDETMKFDASLEFGGGVDILTSSGYFLLELRYSMGFISVEDTDWDISEFSNELDVTNRVLMIYAGYSF